MLLYGLGLALLLSLGFNGFLLMAQRAPRARQADRAYAQIGGGGSDSRALLKHLEACTADNRYKDSLIHALKQVANAPEPDLLNANAP